MCTIDQLVEVAASVASGLEQIMIAALTRHGAETARQLLEEFLFEGTPNGSRAILIQMVVACISEPRVTRLLPDRVFWANLSPMAVLAKQYCFQNALEAAREEKNPDLRRALFQRAYEISKDTITWPPDAAAGESHHLHDAEFFLPGSMVRRH